MFPKKCKSSRRIHVTNTCSTPLPSPPSPLPDLTTDLIVSEILPKLPAKSLLRFKAVCKYFKTVISSRDFICLHSQQSLSSDNRLVIIPSIPSADIHGSETIQTLYAYDLESLSSSHSPSPYASFYFQKDTISLVGSCNGILLLRTCCTLEFLNFDTRLRLVLLNPSTRTLVNVFSDGVKFLNRVTVGLGFDHLTHDFKIVRVSEFQTLELNAVETRTTSVYRVNSKKWKVVQNSLFPSDSMKYGCAGMLIDNRLLHWLFIDYSSVEHKHRVGCFDVCTEQWRNDVLLPAVYYHPTNNNLLQDLSVLDGRLCCTLNNVSTINRYGYSIWLMNEYGVQDSWFKWLNVSMSASPTERLVPVTCRLSEVLLKMLRKKERKKETDLMFWCNSENGELREANVPNLWYEQPYICNDTLVSIPGAKPFD